VKSNKEPNDNMPLSTKLLAQLAKGHNQDLSNAHHNAPGKKEMVMPKNERKGWQILCPIQRLSQWTYELSVGFQLFPDPYNVRIN